MKNTKRYISALMALVMAASSAMYAGAESADDVTTIKPTGGTPFDITPDPESANATVEFDVSPKYMITVPALITLDGDYGQLYTGSGDITAENVFLHEDEAIIVTLTSASKFNMTNAGGGTYKLPYTASGFFGTVDKELGRAVARFETSTEKQTQTVSFSTDETPKYAGKYSDPVVFGISVEAENTVDFSAQGYSNGEKVDECSGDNFNVTFTTGGSNAAAYYDTGSAVRVYDKGSFTVTPNDTSKKITQITVQYHTENHASGVSADTGTYTLEGTTGIWTGESDSVTFTFNSESGTGHVRVQSIEVTLA